MRLRLRWRIARSRMRAGVGRSSIVWLDMVRFLACRSKTNASLCCLDDGTLEQQLARRPGVTRSFMRQAYLDVSGMRIRSIEADGSKRYVFTYKREVDGQMVEIETDISVVDFDRLWSQRRETLQKARYSWPDGPLPLGRRLLQDRRGPHLLCPGRSRDAGRRQAAAAVAAATGRALAGAGAGRRSALHLQAAGRPGACRDGCWPTSARRGRSSEDRTHRQPFGQGAVHLRRQSPGRGPAHLDDQQHPAGAGRDRHRHRRLGRSLLLRLHRRRARGPAQHGGTARDRPGCARHRQAQSTTCSRSCTCSAATASRSSPCRDSTSRCGTSPARRPTCRCTACWAAPDAPACRPMPAC